MALFDLLKKSITAPEPTVEERARAHGWDAINAAFERIYPGQVDPYHRGPPIHRMDDVNDQAAAFDGISAYDAGRCWHYVTYGLTELYGKESDQATVSGFGYELTFKLPKVASTPPSWAFSFLDAIGRSVWDGADLAAGHTLKTGPLDGRPSTTESAVLVVRDPDLPECIYTPNGRVEFLLLVGVEDLWREKVIQAFEQLRVAEGWEAHIVAELSADNPRLVTPIATTGRWGARLH